MADWLEPLDRALAAGNRRGGYLLVMPQYRPELVREAAERYGFACRDFRRERLVPRGRAAAGLSLAELDRFLEEELEGPGAVVQNAEALLATRSEPERRSWFRRFLARERPFAVIVPVVLFGREVPCDPLRVVRPAPEELPADTLLMRLVSMR